MIQGKEDNSFVRLEGDKEVVERKKGDQRVMARKEGERRVVATRV